MRRSIVTFDEMLSGRPLRENSAGAWCLTCLKACDSEQLVEEHRGQRNSAKVLVKCHGSEELGTFEFGSEHWDVHGDLKRAMQRRVWFNPQGHEEAGMTHNKGELKD
jgi:hypothetical protein